MKNKTYLMSFEEIIQYLESRNVDIERIEISSLQAPRCFVRYGDQSVMVSSDLFEKFKGTWWWVEMSDEKNTVSQCCYLADSLQDALRLRPDIDAFYWCNVADHVSRFVSEVIDWEEDEVFLEESNPSDKLFVF